jgi:predicted HTH transcriptional regulator
MIGSVGDILSELASGTLQEHRHANLELKETWREEHGPKLSALGNHIEQPLGWMVIGVDNNGSAVGRDERWARNAEEVISQHLNAHLDPAQACGEVSVVDTTRGWIVVIKVINPGAVVYWKMKAYKKAGTTIAEMRPGEVLELTIKLPGLTDYSKQPWSGAVDETLVTSYMNSVAARQKDLAIAERSGATSEQLLARLSLSGRNAARILFGDVSYRVVLYERDGVPQENAKKYGLYELVSGQFIEQAQRWAQRQLGVSAEPFPRLALKEALANTVAHTAYFENEGEITLEVFPDRIVISNLCLPESGYFANKWFSRSRKTVNNLLMEALRLGGFVDELGRGKNLIFRDSILNGKRPPEVSLEKAGRYYRWRLFLYGGTSDPVQLRLLQRIQETYSDPHKALIAYALVLWRSRPLSEIRNFIDGESLPVFAEVISDLNGPIFYWQEQDRIVLRRWARVLLDEGKDSKTLTLAEEKDLYDLAYDLRTRYYRGVLTPKDLRKLADMGETASERTVSANLLSKWVAEGKIRRTSKGVYEFVPKPSPPVDYKQLLEILRKRPS